MVVGPCTYRLFLFRFTLDQTKNGNQTVTYRFSYYQTKIKMRKTKRTFNNTKGHTNTSKLFYKCL